MNLFGGPMAEGESKTCLRCEQSLPLERFHRDKNRKDGRYPYCRSCHGAQVKARTASPAWKAHKKEYDRARYLANREAVIVYGKAAYLKNPERVKERARAWVANNRARRQLISQS
jgi:NAD-dependent SIR2 family protein deacetylase